MDCLVFCQDLLVTAKVLALARPLGVTVRCVQRAEQGVQSLAGDLPRLVLIDLGFPGLDLADLVPRLRAAAPEATVLAFGPHVQEQKLSAARAAGCDQVWPQGQLHAGLADLLAGLAAAGQGKQRDG